MRAAHVEYVGELAPQGDYDAFSNVADIEAGIYSAVYANGFLTV